jgi:hypothetical protein
MRIRSGVNSAVCPPFMGNAGGDVSSIPVYSPVMSPSHPVTTENEARERHGFGSHNRSRRVITATIRIFLEYKNPADSPPELGLSSEFKSPPLLCSTYLTHHSIAMGNTISPMQRDLSRIDEDTARDAKELLDRLEDMARDRIDLFYEKIRYARYHLYRHAPR